MGSRAKGVHTKTHTGLAQPNPSVLITVHRFLRSRRQPIAEAPKVHGLSIRPPRANLRRSKTFHYTATGGMAK